MPCVPVVMSDRSMNVGGANKFQIIDSDSRRGNDSEAIVGGPIVVDFRPVAALYSVALIAPT